METFFASPYRVFTAIGSAFPSWLFADRTRGQGFDAPAGGGAAVEVFPVHSEQAWLGRRIVLNFVAPSLFETGEARSRRSSAFVTTEPS